MMGLAWDSLWHAIISPQQASDRDRRAWQVEHDKLMAIIQAAAGDPPKLGSLDLVRDGGKGIDVDLGLHFMLDSTRGYNPDNSRVSASRCDRAVS
jgi:hypothetical protein